VREVAHHLRGCPAIVYKLFHRRRRSVERWGTSIANGTGSSSSSATATSSRPTTAVSASFADSFLDVATGSFVWQDVDLPGRDRHAFVVAGDVVGCRAVIAAVSGWSTGLVRGCLALPDQNARLEPLLHIHPLDCFAPVERSQQFRPVARHQRREQLAHGATTSQH